jgi:hypothetical protein
VNGWGLRCLGVFFALAFLRASGDCSTEESGDSEEQKSMRSSFWNNKRSAPGKGVPLPEKACNP